MPPAVSLTDLSQVLFEESGDALFLFDPESERVIDANFMAQRLTGFSHEGLLRFDIRELIHAESQTELKGLRQAYQSTGFFHSQEGYYLRHKEGWLAVNLTVTRLHVKPKSLGLITARDISERIDAKEKLRQAHDQLENLVNDRTAALEQANAALLKQHALLRGLIDSIPDLIFFKDRDGRYLGCNQAYEAAVGKKEAELIGKRDVDVFGKPAAYVPERERPPAPGELVRAEDWITYADGRRVLMETLQTRFRDAHSNVLGLIGICRDITERRRLEDQLLQAKKMEAIGQLAGGLAHDFNNLLTVIMGNLELFLGSSEDDLPERELLLAADDATRRAADLVQQLLGFSRKISLKLQPIDLTSCVHDTLRILERTLDSRIQVAIDCDRPVWPVRADTSQISRVLMNLCLNARDAMPTGGRLTLDVQNVVVRPEEVTGEGRPGEFVRLRVHDTGTGMSPEVQARIFEPFFTTKVNGKGTGLGLAMVYGIVKQHGGWIECRSLPSQGTSFSLYFPKAEDIKGP